MPRAIWSGVISFGLVSVPVKAYTAVRDHEVHFHRVERGTGARVRNRRVSEATGEEVADDDIELGYEIDDGRYVTFEPGELDELRPASTRAIEVSDFVPLADIDPVYYERTYWLAPDGEAGERAYGLLVAAMEDQQRVAIGSLVMRTKQYLAAIRPLDGVLGMSTMRFADEVVPRTSIDELSSRPARVRGKELGLATQIVEALASDWDPERYHDTYTEELRDLIERRAQGEDVVVAEPEPPEESNVVDLMAALQASVDEARAGRSGRGRSGGRSTGRRAPAAKKASSKKGTSKTTSAKKAATKKASTKKASTKKAATKKAARKGTAKRPAGRKAATRRTA